MTDSALRPDGDAAFRRNRWLTVFAAAVILFDRKTDSFLNPQFWGDDALPFFIDSIFVGPEAFLRGYAGFYQLLPRLIAWAATAVDIVHAPSIYLCASVAITLGVVTLALSPRLELRGLPVMALAIVAAPHTGEIYLNPANLQWITALGIFLTLLKTDPARPADWLADGLVIIFAGLSGPFSVLLLPIFVVRVALRRTRATMIVGLLVALTAAVQIWEYTHSNPLPGPASPIQWAQLFAVFFLHGPLSLVGAPWWAKHVSLPVATTLGFCFIGLCAWISLWRRGKNLQPAVAMWAFLILLTVAALKRVRFDHFGPLAFDAADRYFILPKILLLWLLASSVDLKTTRGKVAAATLAAIALLSAPNFRFAPMPDLKWASYCDRIRTGEPVKVPINPDWAVEFPRRDVRPP